MDPNETFRLFINAICDDELEVAMQALKAIKLWMVKGGFAPHVVTITPINGYPVPLMFINNMIDVLSKSVPDDYIDSRYIDDNS